MRRREFIATLIGVPTAWPLAARAQAGQLRTIGFLGTATASAWSPWAAAFMQRARELGWIDGRNVTIEVRWADGRNERFAEIAAEFVRLKADVIVTSGGAVGAVKQATSTIPIVFVLARDPLGAGFVASLARPGGNVTGVSLLSTELAGKRLGLLREVVPGLRRLALMGNVENPNVVVELAELDAQARTLGFEATRVEIRRAEQLVPAIESLRGRASALYVVADPLTIANRLQISGAPIAARVPTMYGQREFVQAGGLISYGTNIPSQFRRAAELVDKILRGAKPADIPVEQPTEFDLVINLKTAKALGLDLPPTLLARADEVIE